MSAQGSYRFSVLVFLGALALPLAGSGASYFPLEKGNFWIYGSDSLDNVVRFEVTERTENIAQADLGGLAAVLRDRGDEIDLEIPEKGFELFYRFVADSTWEHRDLSMCNDRARATVAYAKEPIKTYAGTFADCLEIRFEDIQCLDAGRLEEYWAPGVGLVMWREVRIFGVITWQLLEYDAGGDAAGTPFKRGDVNADGDVNIADAVSALTILFCFQGCSSPPCPDAADTNDDGGLNIADPIRILVLLFADDSPLPPPFSECGPDPTADLLDCPSFEPCP
jgi:hypothetical protein